MKSMGAFIKVHFKTHDRLNDTLGLSRNTINRWYNSNPKKFYMYLTELNNFTQEPIADLIVMIKQRCDDVQAIRENNG